MHDLAALVLQLHLLGGIAADLLAADLRNHVVGDLIGEDLRLIALAGSDSLDLVFELHGARGARAGDGLIGAHDHALDIAELAQGVDRRHGDDGGAVRVRDDAVVLLHVLGVHLRHDQRHVGIETEGGGVIDEHGAGLHDRGGKALGNVVLGRAEHDVEALEGVVLRLFHDDVLPLEGDDLARRARAREQMQFLDGELALREDLHHFLTDCAAGAENTKLVRLHFENSFYMMFVFDLC